MHKVNQARKKTHDSNSKTLIKVHNQIQITPKPKIKVQNQLQLSKNKLPQNNFQHQHQLSKKQDTPRLFLT